MNYEKSVMERRDEVFNWLDNVIASYENYREFDKFPGPVDVTTSAAQENNNRLRINNLKALSEYAELPYTRRPGFTTYILVEYDGIILYDLEV